MCGIAAFLPINKGIPNKRLLLSLGLGNEERGTDNSGISFGKEIIKGYNKTAKFRDLYIENKEKIDSEMLISQPIIIHCRKSTVYNTSCAHPFLFGVKDGEKNTGQFIVGCHNGIITNREELYSKFCGETSRSLLDIDSQYMLVSLLLSDKKEVLKRYEGDAALIFYDEQYFYVWKGACNNIEERSMHYIKTDEGWYFSSTANNMLFASDYNIIPTSVANNELLTFTLDGEFVSSEIIKRVREVKVTEVVYFGTKGVTKTEPSFISVFRNSLREIVDHSNKIVEGKFYVYNYSRIYTLYKQKSTYDTKPIYVIKGIMSKDDVILKVILRQIKKKNFNIVSFLKTFRKSILEIIVEEIPIVINGKLKFILYKDSTDNELRCVDTSIKKKNNSNVRDNFSHYKPEYYNEHTEEFYN